MITNLKSYIVHGVLLIVTFVTTTLAGTEWTYGKSVFLMLPEGIALNTSYTLVDFYLGLPYSICFLLILTAHEFGHYFVAIYYRVKTTLPYYIPLPPMGFMLGTLGAIIRIKSPIRTTQQNFDIGIAGPLAGFVVAICFLVYAFLHLPPPEYIFQFHPEYQQWGKDYALYVYNKDTMPVGVVDVVVGKNLLFLFFENLIAPQGYMPNAHEIIHYPFLFAGFLSLVFTSINLLPIGQLDGGHVLYGLVGYKRHKWIATGVFLLFLFYAGLGFIVPTEAVDKLIYEIPLFLGFMFFVLRSLKMSSKETFLIALAIFTLQYFLLFLYPTTKGYNGWLLFVFVIGRFIGIAHPRSEIEQPLTQGRIVAGWIAMIIFILCFAPNPIELIEGTSVTKIDP